MRVLLYFRGIAGALAFSLFLLPAVSCGRSASWSEALEQTAPPNPERSEIVSLRKTSGVKPKAPGRGSERSRASQRTGRGVDGGQRPEGAQAGDAKLVLALLGDLSCYAGAVRCYVDGRYVGAVGEDGRLEVAIAAGNHYIEIWDSRGRWETEINAAPGGIAEVAIRCDERRDEGEF